MERHTTCMLFSPVFPAPPSPSSAISRGRRKVISDLTPKSQLPVAAPRSGMSTAPSLGSGNLTLSSPLAQRPETGGCDSGCCFASNLPPQLYTLNPVQRPQKEVPPKGEGKRDAGILGTSAAKGA